MWVRRVVVQSLAMGVAIWVLVASPLPVWASTSHSLTGEPVPDVDKVDPNVHRSCWLAGAANVLGAAGWGIGAATPENPNPSAGERAYHIYQQLWNDLYKGAGGDTYKAIRHWVQHYGQNSRSPDYAPNNPWFGQRRVGAAAAGGIKQQQYVTLMGEMDAGNYVNVSFSFGGDYGNHIITAVELQSPEPSPSYSVWHDNNGDNSPPDGDDDQTRNYFLGPVGNKRWGIDSPYDPDENFNFYSLQALVLYPVQGAYGGSIPVKPSKAMGNFDVSYCAWLDEEGNKVKEFSVSGDMAGIYTCPNPDPNRQTEPFWVDNYAVTIPNQACPGWAKDVYLQVSFTTSQGPDDPNILLELPWGERLEPNDAIWSLEHDILLLHWTIEGDQPGYETIVFPGGQYRQLFDPTTGEGGVYDWSGATICVPEPTTLALLTLGGLGLLRRRHGLVYGQGRRC